MMKEVIRENYRIQCTLISGHPGQWQVSAADSDRPCFYCCHLSSQDKICLKMQICRTRNIYLSINILSINLFQLLNGLNSNDLTCPRNAKSSSRLTDHRQAQTARFQRQETVDMGWIAAINTKSSSSNVSTYCHL